MSHRPTTAKGIRRLRKALRRTPRAYIDVVEWVEAHTDVRTRREARELLLAGRLRSDSHVVGRVTGVDESGAEVTLVQRYQPASLRGSLRVVA